MKKLITVLLMFYAVNSYAYDWQKYGIEKKSGEDSVSTVLTDSEGRIFYVENEESVNDSTAAKIIEIRDIIFQWKYINAARLKFLVKPNEIEVSVIPDAFTYEKNDFLKNVKAGLLFSYTDEAFRYNFRILTKNVFVRISGVYLDENLLCKKIAEAVKDPQAFIQRRDADYFLARIEKLDQKVDELQAEVSSSGKRLNYAVMAYQNDRFFGGSKPIAEDLVMEVFRIKSENPSITVVNMKKELDAKKIKYTDKELRIILAVYFGEM